VELQRQPQTTINRSLRLAQRSIIFFGVPHPTYRRRDWWPKLSRLLKIHGKISKSSLDADQDDVSLVAHVCSSFEKLGLDGTILSFYEEKPTRTNQWTRSKSLVSPIPTCNRNFHPPHPSLYNAPGTPISDEIFSFLGENWPIYPFETKKSSASRPITTK
jgi:hypothetical protein